MHDPLILSLSASCEPTHPSIRLNGRGKFKFIRLLRKHLKLLLVAVMENAKGSIIPSVRTRFVPQVCMHSQTNMHSPLIHSGNMCYDSK